MQKIMFLFKLLFSLSLAVLLYLGWLYNNLQGTLAQPLAIEAPTEFVVETGNSMSVIAHRLNQMGIYTHPEFLSLTAKLKEIDSSLKVGEYLIEPGMTPLDLLEMFSRGKVVQHNIIFVEGWTFRQMITALAGKDDLQKQLTDLSDEQIMAKLGKAEEHPEGRFFPDNYFYTSNSSDIDILKRAYQAMEKHAQALWKERQKDLPYNDLYEAMIMASIIEKETGHSEERAQIAGVFVRRLKKGMKLQTDPTVIYGIGQDFDGNITRKHLRTDTPYNTYTREGLPPTPIALFGRAALEAALNPAEGKALYFVAKGNGQHQFSATLKEHNQAVAKYQLGKK